MIKLIISIIFVLNITFAGENSKYSINYWSSIYKKDRKNYNALFNLGLSYFFKRKYESAIYIFDKIISRRTKHLYKALYLKSYAYFKINDITMARISLTKLEELKPPEKYLKKITHLRKKILGDFSFKEVEDFENVPKGPSFYLDLNLKENSNPLSYPSSESSDINSDLEMNVSAEYYYPILESKSEEISSQTSYSFLDYAKVLNYQYMDFKQEFTYSILKKDKSTDFSFSYGVDYFDTKFYGQTGNIYIRQNFYFNKFSSNFSYSYTYNKPKDDSNKVYGGSSHGITGVLGFSFNESDLYISLLYGLDDLASNDTSNYSRNFYGFDLSLTFYFIKFSWENSFSYQKSNYDEDPVYLSSRVDDFFSITEKVNWESSEESITNIYISYNRNNSNFDESLGDDQNYFQFIVGIGVSMTL